MWVFKGMLAYCPGNIVGMQLAYGFDAQSVERYALKLSDVEF